MIIKYKKIINLLDSTTNQPSKFGTKNWIELNDDSRGTYYINSQIRFETSMLKSSLCNYSDTCIHIKGTITIPNTVVAGAATNNINKNFKIVLHLLIA